MNGSTAGVVPRALATALAAALVGGLVTIGTVVPAGASTTSTLHVATIAGNGTEGTSGDTGPSYDAVLNDPTAVAVDNVATNADYGDIAIAESGTSPAIRVIAGSTGTQFGKSMTAGDTYTIVSGIQSTGIAFDGTGNLVFTDPDVDEIGRVAVADGALAADVVGVPATAPAGGATVPATGTPATSAKIQPFGLAVDPTTGNILFSDRDGGSGSPAIRYLAETTGTYFGKAVTAGDVYTLTSTPGTYALDGVAVDATNGNVVFAVGNSDAGPVVELDAPVSGTYYGVHATAGTPVVIAGTQDAANSAHTVSGAGEDAVAATSATLNMPKGLFVDPSGNVLIADSGDHAVRAVAATSTAGASLYGVGGTDGLVAGDIYTVAGTGSTGPPTQYALATAGPLGTVTGVAVPSGRKPVLTDASHNELDELGAATAPSEAPPNPNATGANGGSAFVTWQAIPVTSEGFTAPTHYTVAWYTCTAVGSCTATAAGTATVAAPSTSTTVENLTAGQLYSFTVAGANGQGPSPASSPVYATADASAPGPVANLAATATSGQMTATWTPPANDGGSPVTGYTATLSPCSTACTRTLVAPARAVTFTGLTNGGTYSIAVAATNAAGTGPWSSVSAQPTGVPGTPTITKAAPGNGQVLLTWSAPTANGGSPITGYVVRVEKGSTAATTEPTGSAGTSYTVAGLTNGTTYTFSVAAVNARGTGTYSSAVGAAPVSSPSAPTNVTATAAATGTTVHVTWTDPAANGTTVTGYTLSATPAGGGTPVTTTVATATATTGTLTGLAKGTTYNVTVAADDTGGTGPASAPAQVTATSAPGAPSDAVATSKLDGSGDISLTWGAPATHGSVVTGYTVTVSGLFTVTTLSTTTTYTVTGGTLAPGAAYAFTVKATNAAGTGPTSAPSDGAASVTVPAKPTTPTATADPDGTVTLTWTEPAGGTHGATVTSYTVTPTPACPSCTGLVVRGDPAGTSTTIGGLTLGTEYAFTVKATNAAGTGPTSTASATVTPATVPTAPTHVKATAGLTGTAPDIAVAWTPATPQGAAVTHDTVTVTPATGGVPAATVTIPGTTTTVAITTGLTPGTTYTVTVTATNAAGTGPASLPVATVVPAPEQGYWISTSSGGVYAYGGARYYGAAGAYRLNEPVVSMAATPDHEGYWQVAGDGGIFAFGDAGFYGSTGSMHLNQPVVGMAPTGDGQGYWLVAADGGVFAFGDAGYHGSLPGLGVSVDDVVGIVPTADGGGYWMVGADGGVFAFGDAGFHGSLPGLGIGVHDIVGFVPTPDGGGYWMVGADGGVFAFGDAGYFGSLGGQSLGSPVAGLAATPSGNGYWLVAQDGYVFTEGDATYEGSPVGAISGQTVVALVSSG